MQDYSNAKQIFDKYEGSFFHMERDGRYRDYKRYMVPEAVERKWRYEKIEKYEKILLECKNKKTIVEAFGKYSCYVVQIEDEDKLKFMLNYVCEHKNEWDTNTLLRSINTIFSSVSFIKKRREKKRIIKECISILKSILDEEIEATVYKGLQAIKRNKWFDRVERVSDFPLYLYIVAGCAD